MAAADEEGSNGENKKDDPLNKNKNKYISIMHQELLNKLNKTGLTYEGKVTIVLTGWDHLAGSGSATSGQEKFASFLYRFTLQLILQGEWPKLERIVKTRLDATLQRCAKDAFLTPMCTILLPLVSDPWGHPTLKAIFASSYVPNEEAMAFIDSESWDVVRVRINTLLESKCEKISLPFLKVCVRCLQQQVKLDKITCSEEDKNFFFDLYYVLLYKFQKSAFVEEARLLNLPEGVEHVRRLLSIQDKSKVWKHRLKVAELETQIFLASVVVQPYDETFWTVFCVWCDVMKVTEIDLKGLTDMVRKYLQLAKSSTHIYNMASILRVKFGNSHNMLVTELLIRALTLDMNTLEMVKNEKNTEEQARIERQMADGFIDLSVVFEQHYEVSRECVLTAFSIHPTQERLDKILFLCEMGLIIKSEPKEHDNFGEMKIKVEPGIEIKQEPNIEVPLTDTGQTDYLIDTNRTLQETMEKATENGLDLDNAQSEQRNYGCENKNITVKTEPPDGNFHSENNYCEKNVEDIYPQNINEPNNDLDLFLSSSEDLISQLNNEIKTRNNIGSPKSPGNNSMSPPKNRENLKNNPSPVKPSEHFQIKESISPVKPRANFKNKDILTNPQEILNHMKLGMPKELCDDLAVVLSSPRWQILTWVLTKEDLMSICEKYLKNIDSAKNVTKELKFLKLDYSQFEHLPTQEVSGIEKGYEHFMEVEDSDIEEIIYEDYDITGLYSSYSSEENTSANKVKSFMQPLNKKRGRPRLIKDSDSSGKRKYVDRDYLTSASESQSSDSDYVPIVSDDDLEGTRVTSVGCARDEMFEGKRVTSFICNDKSKRVRIDATGKLTLPKSVASSSLRLYRHAPTINRQKLAALKLANSPSLTIKSTVNSKSLQIIKSTNSSMPTKSTISHNTNSKGSNMNTKKSSTIKPSSGKTNSSVIPKLIPKPNILKPNTDRSSIVKPNVNKSQMLKAITEKLERSIANKTNPSLLNPSTNQKKKVNILNSSLAETKSTCNAGLLSSIKDNKNIKIIKLPPSASTSKETSEPQKTNPVNAIISGNGWKYSGYLKSTTSVKTTNASLPIRRPSINPSSGRCSYRTKEGRVITVKPKTFNNNNSKFEDIFRSFLQQRSPETKSSPANTIRVLKKHNPAVSVKKHLNMPNCNAEKLANAQKETLKRILSPDTSQLLLNSSSNSLLHPIAMPVSHNPPNMPSDKSSPVSLSRVLPKGTTVERKTKTDSRAGPSGLNNGGSSSASGSSSRGPSRPAISITPSNAYLIPASLSSSLSSQSNIRGNVVRTIIDPQTGGSTSSFQSAENPSPLAVATVVGSVSQTVNPRFTVLASSPGETPLAGVTREILLNAEVTCGTTTTTTVASHPGETRAPSMLETLLRDRSSSLLIQGSGSAHTITTCSIQEPLVAVSPINTGTLDSTDNFVTSHITNSSVSESQQTSVVATGISSTILENSANLRASLIAGSSGLGLSIVGSNSLSGNVIVSRMSSQASSLNSGSLTLATSNSSDGNSSGLPQVLVPAQLIQVQGNVGSTPGLSIVHPGLDFRLPPGTRVLKPSTTMRQTAPVTITQSNARPLNVLHKIVPNRHILRTVVVPHSVPLQSLNTQSGTQILTLNQGGSGSTMEVTSKIPQSQLQKMLGHNVVPGGLFIRTVRPANTDNISIDSILPKSNPSTIIHHTADAQQKITKSKETEKPTLLSALVQAAPEEGSGERINRNYLKALLASTSTQSVGTQTQTTAVKPVTGQFVSQVMNQLRGINTVATTVSVSSSIPSPSPLNLGSSNAVSSETLEQLREFESVFEKVSNKSVKESESTASQSDFTSSGFSSEESMIATQLLNMANESAAITTSASFVYSATSVNNQVTSLTSVTPTSTQTTGVLQNRLGEGTFITIPCTTQAGTLILVNPSSSSGIVTMATSNAEPPPAASPALSSTSSHSSVPSSPSSSSSKNKNTRLKVTPPPPSVTPKPKSPPPPKVPPKPAPAKPQVEETEETKARIQAILEQYKLDLANTPQPQPAPRNRKNCPPPKNEGKSSSKKKSGSKKPDGTMIASPGASDLPSVSPSPGPAATPSGEDSEGSIGAASVASSQFQVQEEKKNEDAASTSSSILQGVVVSNMKVENASLTALPPGRVVQLFRQGNKLRAITRASRPPYNKTGLAAGVPPPNVTIQGQININELMENQLALLTAGGATATINSTSVLLSKLLQSQQPVVVQTSGVQGQSVLQQLSIQPVLATHTKVPLQSQVIAGRTNASSLHNSRIKTQQPSPQQHQQASSPSTPEFPNTPSSFPNQEEDSNSSAQSHEGTTSGPLPPFFTLTKQFMVPSTNVSPGTFRDKSTTGDAKNDPSSSNSSSASRTHFYARSGSNLVKTLSLGNCKGVKTTNIILTQSAPSSPLITQNDNNLLDMSSVSEPSSLENSPSIVSQRPTLNAAGSDLRSNSLDSIKSDLSVEEVQIPPSPATLTKQLQSAYMTEAALSPAISQAHLSSSSSYSSPSNVAELHFTDSALDDQRGMSPNLGNPSHSYSLASTSRNGSSLSNTSTSNNNAVIDNTSLACLSSPSGDVYLDQAGVGLGLDHLPLGEVRPQSPLSDLVPAVPLLPWSPRSGDSIMGQSPSLNDALTGNMTLDVHHSEDSLCDSSTGFPSLFSMEGDAASVSSSASEDLQALLLSSQNQMQSTSSSVSIFSTAPSNSQIMERRISHTTNGKKMPPSREQDRTVTSTRGEVYINARNSDVVSSMLSDALKKEDSNSPMPVEDYPWSTNNSSSDKELPFTEESENMDSDDSKDMDGGPSSKNSKKQNFLNKNITNERRRSQRQLRESSDRFLKDHFTHNGYEEKLKDEKDSAMRRCSISDILFNNLKNEKKEESEGESKTKSDAARKTRGSKRRSDPDFFQDDKRSKGCRSRRSEPMSASEVKMEEDNKLLGLDEVALGATTRSLRSRHTSNTSDSSSNYSVDRVSTPGPVGGRPTRRKRRGSHDSSTSSRDGSPLTLLNIPHDGSSGTTGMHTRRSSSRDHAKKTRCRCCVDSNNKSFHGNSNPSSSTSSVANTNNRRVSGRASRGSGTSTS